MIHENHEISDANLFQSHFLAEKQLPGFVFVGDSEIVSKINIHKSNCT